MDHIRLSVARRLVPDFMETLQSRVHILHRIRLLQPIGRRALAAQMGETERVLRAEVDLLRQQGLVVSTASGMSLSEEGNAVLDEMDDILAAMEGRQELAVRLSKLLGISDVRVVQGDSDSDDWVKSTLGYQAAVHLRDLLTSSDVLAVTGGSTMHSLAEMMPEKGPALPVKVVPARGGLGEIVSIQSNTIAARLAERLGGSSVMLHVPDQLSPETLERLTTEPQVQTRLLEIRSATVVVHGIGDAIAMAKRRRLDADEMAMLRDGGAVAEAFGYYFDAQGRPVYAMTTVGLRLEDLQALRVVMGVAGGASKAAAIQAAAKAYQMNVLVTDEGAAKKILAAE